jgi:hypothetical protein
MPTEPPFDYKKPFRQKNGRRAKFECIDSSIASFPLRVSREVACGLWQTGLYTLTGKRWLHRDAICDLINIPTEEPVMKDFDPKKPCRQRNGLGARVRITDAAGRFPIFAEVEDHDGSWDSQFRCANGHFLNCTTQHQLDLVNIPTPQEVWVNVYQEEGDVLWCGSPHASRAIADKKASDKQSRVGCNHITIRAEFDQPNPSPKKEA